MSIAALSVIVLGFFAPQLIAAAVLQGRQSTVVCDFSTAANSGDTCSSFAAEWGLTVDLFKVLNPGTVCPNLVAGTNYCIIGTPAASTTTASTSQPASISSTSLKTTTTSTGPTFTKLVTTTTNTSSLPSPTQSDLISTCNSFHLVASGDSCSKLEAIYGILTATFLTWNPSINTACSNLFIGYYVCIGVLGLTATISSVVTTTASSSSSGPSPQMPSIITTCDTCHVVTSPTPAPASNPRSASPGPSHSPGIPSSTQRAITSSDGCHSIETTYGITSAQFSDWNPYVDTTCNDLWPGYYICVGV